MTYNSPRSVNEILKVPESSKCKINEYFDNTLLSCIQCDTKKNLRPSVDRSRCICNEFSKQIGLNNDYPLCVFCGPNATITIDGRDCIACNNAMCRCSTNEIQIDRNLDGTLLNTMYCLPCPANTYLSLDGFKCLPCNDLEYNLYINHKYLSKYYARIQDHCPYGNASFSHGLDTNTTYIIKLKNQSIDSYYFSNELQSAIYFCKRKHKLACEHLSNMCALSLYSNKMACTLFMQIQPPVWLFYNKNETTTVLNTRQITQKYSLSKHDGDSTLNFTFVTFYLHGNLKSIDTPDIPCNLLKYIRFGVNFNRKCKFTIKNLLNAEVEFISPYLTFMENKKILMHALPVLIKNINQNENNILHWQFVRKFFLVDNISGYKASNFTDSKVENVSTLSVLRYMKSLTVIINIQNAENRNKIFPPLLIVEYTELTHEQISKTSEVTLKYKIQFILNDRNTDFNFKIIVGVLSGLALSVSGIKTWSHSKQHYANFSYIAVLFWFFIYAMGAVGTVIILNLISLCIYLCIFYKRETVPYILLFDDINEKTIKMFTTIAFAFKFIEMLGFIYRYWNINIFFIDWEQPKPTYNQFKYDSPDISLYKLQANKLSDNKYKFSETTSEILITESDKREDNCSAAYSILKNSAQEINRYNNFHRLPVSIWRTYFVANQWLELQTKRKINVMVQLVAVLCIFKIIQIYPWVITIPELIPKFPEENSNFTVYYTMCTLVYVLIYCIQWLLSTIFYERHVTNRMQKFINLCSVANISVFILPFNYYGFYIHGRSVHGYADTDLPTLMNDLEKEKNNLCAHRGLLPGTSQQTFILSLAKTFKIVFTTLSKQKKFRSNNFLKTYFFSTTNWEQTFDRQFKLKEFLCKFVDHCFKDVDYIIKEQYFFEKLFNTLFLHKAEKSIFYIDNNHSFDQVLFYGNEWLLATFEISIFTFMLVLYEDCILAVTVAVSISMLLIAIVKHNRKKNLDNNILLDKTFFM
ncbi:meckelin [Colletes latitarsis]|uniref:meckelin n=1 Tax=Colletes latitarsis TaxID=2605962 RepID=UPI004036CB43